MRIYRIETKCRKYGAYHSWTDMMDRRCHTSPRNPTPPDDGINFNMSNVFGFQSLSHLLRRFDREDLCILGNEGYVIHVYDIPDCDVIVGGKQVAFYRDSRIPIEELPLPKRPFNMKEDSACPLLPKDTRNGM